MCRLCLRSIMDDWVCVYTHTCVRDISIVDTVQEINFDLPPPHKSVIFRDNLFYNARLISKYYITNYSKRLFFKFYGKLLNGILKLFRLLLPIYNFTCRYISRYIEIHHPVAILLISSIKQDYENGGQTTLTIKDNHEFVRNFLSLLFIKLN